MTSSSRSSDVSLVDEDQLLRPSSDEDIDIIWSKLNKDVLSPWWLYSYTKKMKKNCKTEAPTDSDEDQWSPLTLLKNVSPPVHHVAVTKSVASYQPEGGGKKKKSKKKSKTDSEALTDRVIDILGHHMLSLRNLSTTLLAQRTPATDSQLACFAFLAWNFVLQRAKFRGEQD